MSIDRERAVALGVSKFGFPISPEGDPEVSTVVPFFLIQKLINLISQVNPTSLFIALDVGKSFRKDLSPKYKAHRKPMPRTMQEQISLCIAAMEAMHIPHAGVDGFEADDIVASYTDNATADGQSVCVATSDKDLMQVVGEDVCLYNTRTGKWIGHQQVVDAFGVPPRQVADVQCLAGDSADGVPGVSGIGPKRAAALVSKCGDWEAVADHCTQGGDGVTPSIARAVARAAASGELATMFELVKLRTDVQLPIPLHELRLPPPEQVLSTSIPFLQELGFWRSLREWQRVLESLALTNEEQSLALANEEESLANEDIFVK